ncbi:MAG: peptidoglycan-binding domain-containing protein [Pseudomonadota bacterium]
MIGVLKRGSKGPFVAEIQEKLNAVAGFHVSPYHGNGASALAPLSVDGKYGPLTAARVEEFQKRNPPLRVDGRVGPNTFAKLTAKLWTPAETQKAAGSNPTPPATPKAVEKHLYIHCPPVPGAGDHGTQHKANDCIHVILPEVGLSTVKSEIESAIKAENAKIKDVVLNAHGSGTGVAIIGGTKVDLTTPDNLRFFDPIKPHFAAQGIIWIFACAFATPVRPTSDADAWLVHDWEVAKGAGTAGMRRIAQYTGRPVRASYGVNFGDMSGFTAPWAEVTPAGTVTIHQNGRALSPDETTLLRDTIGGIYVKQVTLSPVPGLWRLILLF